MIKSSAWAKLCGYLVVKLLCLNPVFEFYKFYHISELPESSQPAPGARQIFYFMMKSKE